MLCELETLAKAAHPSSGSPPKALNPRPLLRHVKRLGRHLTFGRQEDSHELFVRLVEAVEAVQVRAAAAAVLLLVVACCLCRACCAVPRSHATPPAPPHNRTQLLEAGGKSRYDLRSRETTLIHHVFGGQKLLRCSIWPA